MSTFNTVKNEVVKDQNVFPRKKTNKLLFNILMFFAQSKFVANAILKPSWDAEVDFWSFNFSFSQFNLCLLMKDSAARIQLMSYKHTRQKQYLKTRSLHYYFHFRGKCGLEHQNLRSGTRVNDC